MLGKCCLDVLEAEENLLEALCCNYGKKELYLQEKQEDYGKGRIA